MGFHVYTILRDKELKQNERVIMRLPESLLKAAKVNKAARSGMPYQHFIRQVLEAAVQPDTEL